MNEENDWDHNVEGESVDGPVVCVSREEVLQALNENRKSPITFRSITRVDCCYWGSMNPSDGLNMSGVLDGLKMLHE